MIADHNPIQPAPGLRTASDPGLSKAVAKHWPAGKGSEAGS